MDSNTARGKEGEPRYHWGGGAWEEPRETTAKKRGGPLPMYNQSMLEMIPETQNFKNM